MPPPRPDRPASRCWARRCCNCRPAWSSILHDAAERLSRAGGNTPGPGLAGFVNPLADSSPCPAVRSASERCGRCRSSTRSFVHYPSCLRRRLSGQKHEPGPALDDLRRSRWPTAERNGSSATLGRQRQPGAPRLIRTVRCCRAGTVLALPWAVPSAAGLSPARACTAVPAACSRGDPPYQRTHHPRTRGFDLIANRGGTRWTPSRLGGTGRQALRGPRRAA